MNFVDICNAVKEVFDKSDTTIKPRLEYLENKIYSVKLYDDVMLIIKADSYTDAENRVIEVMK